MPTAQVWGQEGACKKHSVGGAWGAESVGHLSRSFCFSPAIRVVGLSPKSCPASSPVWALCPSPLLAFLKKKKAQCGFRGATPKRSTLLDREDVIEDIEDLK